MGGDAWIARTAALFVALSLVVSAPLSSGLCAAARLGDSADPTTCAATCALTNCPMHSHKTAGHSGATVCQSHGNGSSRHGDRVRPEQSPATPPPLTFRLMPVTTSQNVRFEAFTCRTFVRPTTAPPPRTF